MELPELIEHLVTRGSATLEDDTLQAIKAECKQSDNHVQMAYTCIMDQLKKPHAQIRYSCVQLADVLFTRSHEFRICMLDNMPTFLPLVLGINDTKLPPPKEWGVKLRQLATSTLKQWHDKFGAGYKQLRLAFTYLQENAGVSFAHEDIYFGPTRERASRDTRSQEVRLQKYNAAVAEMEKQRPDVLENLKVMNGCFEILVPRLDAQTPPAPPPQSQDANLSHQNMAQEYGLGSNSYELVIQVPKTINVTETKENAVVFQTLREAYKELLSHRQQILLWLDIITKFGVEDPTRRNTILRKAVDLKAAIDDVKLQALALSVPLELPHETGDDEDYEEEEEDDDDDEFVEVKASSSSNKPKVVALPKPAQKTGTRPDEILPVYGASVVTPALGNAPIFASTKINPDVKGKKRDASDDADPRHSISSVKRTKISRLPITIVPPGTIVDTESNLRTIAPVVEYADDLFYWDKQEVAFNKTGIDFAHRFYGSVQEEHMLSEDTLADLKKRVVFVTHEQEEITPCRARLPNGKLCPRRDIEICPFHGRKVARDDAGIALDTKDQQRDAERELERQRRKATALLGSSSAASGANGTESDILWQQIAYDVRVNLGLDGVGRPINGTRVAKKEEGRGGARGGQSNKNGSELIDLKKKKETPKQRIVKKLEAAKASVEADLEYEASIRSKDRNAFRAGN
ncbi:hypothetical protein SmJEL517_g05918 [Synchytrium microbalum]|uniref:UV-stimulated scaffold protein A C-terminal domain-containing protein n=1 Tax=Synchytrium microbalum TaxID=1806994 RepID=A0A507BXT8_9FUNG|nr:uncharacterized protein SmJEL517_g05918 [Synchytrium microbalum]TPX30536.1 hypothetical protein SmJEL517_g05918 [Synchytrium microbalum]